MSRFDQEHIKVEPFDREYRLEELLPRDLLATLCPPWAPLLPKQWAICAENGAVHFTQGLWRNPTIDLLSATLDQSRPDRKIAIGNPPDARLIVFPVDYELETKGYLVIDADHQGEDAFNRLGRAGANLLRQLMRLKHQTMLTSGLHGAVVEESYAQLKEKASQLARSEERYRKLAANLEIEVQKKTEEIRLAHARLMNQEKMAAIGQLSAGMAHEINNPLGFIISNLGALKGYAADLTSLIGHYRQLVRCCADQQGAIGPGALMDHCRATEKLENEVDAEFLLSDMPTLTEESMSGAQRIQKIVRDLKIVARPGENDPESIDVHTSIDAVLTILQNRIGPKIDVHRAYGPVSLISGYPQEINQVWFNLILNALEAMNGKGTLGIETRTENSHVMVTVRDTGAGIAQATQTKIFEPFFTTKEIGQGTGLGLHLAYQTIAKHNGRIEVNSTPGQGSRFMVCLPVAGRE